MFEPRKIDAEVAGHPVRIRSMSAKERLAMLDRLGAAKTDAERGFLAMCEVVALCVLRVEDEARLFDSAEAAGDVDAIILEDLFNLCAAHNHLNMRAKRADGSAEKNG
jgi:hypothetical protein